MLTFSKLEKKGNLGNQLFQIASTIGLAKKHNKDFGFNTWSYNKYFEHNLPKLKAKQFKHLQEKNFEYHEWEIGDGDYDIEGWLQTEKYFDKELTNHYFSFKDEVVQTIKNKYDNAFKKETILLSIRRGDFVEHPDYFQTPIKFFLNALSVNFSNWQELNLIVLSDDIAYCKYHFGFLSNAFFGDGLNAVEQLCLGSLCQHFIISNSTFSWWSAWLGEKENSKIIRPIKNFRGAKALELNDKDYFPERWIAFDFEKYKIKLQADFYLKSGFQKLLIEDYLKYYFNFNNLNYVSDFENLSVNEKDVTALLNNVLCSPISIWDAYLFAKSNQQSIIVSSTNLIKVNYKLSYKRFQLQKDFGVFSSVFKFNQSKNGYHHCFKIQVNKNNENTKQVILPIIGRFTKNFGFGYYYQQKKRKTIIFIKKSVKKLIKPKQ